MLNAMSWILTAIALIGTWKNSNGERDGFYFWLVSNTGFCCVFMLMGLWPQFFLFAVYTFLSIRGLSKWTK